MSSNMANHSISQPDEAAIPASGSTDPCEGKPEELFGVCPYVTAQQVLAGKWTILILHHLSGGAMRFGELWRAMPSLTQATLTKQLRQMEANGLVIRRSYNEIPPRVEYSLSPLGEGFRPVLEQIESWGDLYIDYLRTRPDDKGLRLGASKCG